MKIEAGIRQKEVAFKVAWMVGAVAVWTEEEYRCAIKVKILPHTFVKENLQFVLVRTYLQNVY